MPQLCKSLDHRDGFVALQLWHPINSSSLLLPESMTCFQLHLFYTCACALPLHSRAIKCHFNDSFGALCCWAYCSRGKSTFSSNLSNNCAWFQAHRPAVLSEQCTPLWPYLRRGWKIAVMFLAPGLHTNFISPPSIKLSSAPPGTKETDF